MYTPRTQSELHRLALGSLVTRSELSDTHEGSVIDTLARSMGAMGASVEQRIALVRDAFDFRNATGAELDARLSEFPPETVSRLAATYATGIVTVSFSAALAQDTTIEQGSSFGSTSRAEGLWAVTADTVIPAGAASANLSVTASVEGLGGNIGAALIDTIIGVSSSVAITVVTVTNDAPIANGREEESDVSLKRRAMLYLQSLSRCQVSALEYAALSYKDQPERIELATVYEDPHQRGYSELIIDDGSGKLDQRLAAGAVYSGTVSASGLTVMYHDSPSVNEVIPTQYNPVTSQQEPLDDGQFVSIPERGVIYIDEGVMVTGRQWSMQPYQVYTGPIANIQRLIEGDPSAPTTSPAFRAAGTRVRVLAPSVLRLNFDATITPLTGYNLDDLVESITLSLEGLTLTLRVGDPLFVAAMIDTIMGVEGVQNVRLYAFQSGNTNAPTPLDDIYPPPRQVIRIGTVNTIPVIEET